MDIIDVILLLCILILIIRIKLKYESFTEEYTNELYIPVNI